MLPKASDITSPKHGPFLHPSCGYRADKSEAWGGRADQRRKSRWIRHLQARRFSRRLDFLFDLTKGKNESFQIFTRGIRGKDLHRGSELEQRAGDLRGARGARQREFSHMGRVPAGSLSK